VAESLNDGIWDQEVLLKRLGGRQDRAHELIGIYLKRLPEQQAEFIAMLKSQDAAGIGQVVHEIKGVAATLGSIDLAEISIVIETAARENDLTIIEASADEFQSRLKAFELSLRKAKF